MLNRQVKQNLAVLAALGIALATGILCWVILTARNRNVDEGAAWSHPAGDFGWSYNAAQEFLLGLDPYRHPPQKDYGPYPFPAVVLAFPFLLLPPTIAAALFISISSGLMAHGLAKENWFKLLTFASCPFFTALQWVQWTPLIFASAFLPVLAITVCVKPHVALPVFLTHIRKVALVAASCLLALSLIIYPSWPFDWLKGLGGYQSFWPFFTIPGPLLLLAFKRWKDPDAKFLLLASLFPQRWFYDALILWLIPKTRKEFLYTSLWSWVAFFWLVTRQPQSTIERGAMCVLSFHIPMLIVILKRPTHSVHDEAKLSTELKSS